MEVRFESNVNTMRALLLYCFIFLGFTQVSMGQIDMSKIYNATAENPFGLPHPDAPEQIKDYAPMIGICDCVSTSRNPDGTWAEPVEMVWTWKYILNGTAVQDESLKSDGIHGGSIRQYSIDSARWYVHFYSAGRVWPRLNAWEGNLSPEKDKIVLTKDSPAPGSGTPGDYRLTFYDLSEEGFKWIAEWIDKPGSIVYPNWKITCKKRKE